MTFEKMKQGAKRFYAPAVAGASLLAGSGAANAAVTIDVDDVVQTITGGVTVVSAIGVAVLSLVVVIKLFSGCARPSKARPTLQQSGGRQLSTFFRA